MAVEAKYRYVEPEQSLDWQRISTAWNWQPRADTGRQTPVSDGVTFLRASQTPSVERTTQGFAQSVFTYSV